MEKVTLAVMKKEIYSWSLRFQIAKPYSNEELLFLAEEYLEDLQDEDVSQKQFVYACKVVRKRNKFFPKVADILDAVKEYRENPPASDSLQLPEDAGQDAPLSAEQARVNAERLAILGKIASGEITYEEGTKRMEQLT